MYLVTYFVTNFVSFSVRKYSHFSSPYLVMYLVIYFVTFLVKSHVLLYWRSIIGATKYRKYLYCLLMQFYGDFRFNLALVVSSLIINISCPLLSFGAECPLGWSEKPKSLKSKNEQADYLPRHSPDVRSVFEIYIRPFVSCEIGLTQFTETGIRFTKPSWRHFTEKSPNYMKPR